MQRCALRLCTDLELVFMPNVRFMGSVSFSDDWGLTDGSVSGDDFLPQSLVGRNPRPLIETAQKIAAIILERWGGTPPFIPPSPKAAAEYSFRLLKVEENVKSIILLVNELSVSVRTSVGSAVRNQVHLEHISRRVRAVEKKIDEAVWNSKQALDVAARNQLLTVDRLNAIEKSIDVLSQGLKHGKSNSNEFVKNARQLLKDLKPLLDFPDKVGDMAVKVGVMADKVSAMLEWLFYLTWLLSLVTLNEGLDSPIAQVPEELAKLTEDSQGLIWSEGNFVEIGRQCKDLLNEHFDSGLNLEVHSDSVEMVPSINEKFVLDLGLDGKASYDRHDVFARFCLQNIDRPDLKGTLRVTLPHTPMEGEVRYIYPYGGVLASTGITHHPLVKCSTIFGVKGLVLGGSIAYDSALGTLTQHDVALSYNMKDFAATFATYSQFDIISFSIYRRWSKQPIECGGELRHTFSTNRKKITVGLSHAIDLRTSIKARLTSTWDAGAALVYRLSPKATVSVSAELSLRHLPQLAQPRFGLSLKFGPPA